MTKLLFIAAGGAAGAVIRYLLSGWCHRASDTTFPIGTLAVNVLGCLLIGALTAVFTGPYVVREEYRAALLVGLLGGLTTFSTVGWETLALVNDGGIRRAMLNVFVTNAFALAAVWVGYRAGQRLVGV